MDSPRTRRADRISSGFLRSIMQHRSTDDLVDEQVQVVTHNHHERRVTQAEQNVKDEKARKEAMRNLINSWQERLQLISVITTFFATMEAAMLVNTKPVGASELESNVLKVSNATFMGSLILHVYASVLAFLGAFLLISYKLREARREEMIVEGIKVADSPRGICDVERGAVDPGLSRTTTRDGSMAPNFTNNGTGTSTPAHGSMDHLNPAGPPVFTTNPHIVQVGSLMSNASSLRLLGRIHAICIFLTAVGFILVITGIVCYAWVMQPLAVSIFASVCLGEALLCTFVLFV